MPTPAPEAATATAMPSPAVPAPPGPAPDATAVAPPTDAPAPLARRPGLGTWHGAVASRKNDEGMTSFITIDRTVDGFNFVVAERDGKRALVIRDAQHEPRLIEHP